MAAHVWNGSTWLPIKRLPVWNGSSFIAGNRHVWNGSNFVGFQDDVNIISDNIQSFFIGSGNPPAVAGWEITTAGIAGAFSGTLSSADRYTWCLNSSNVGQYEIFCTFTSGLNNPSLDGTSSPVNTHLSLSTGRNWSISTSSVDFSATLNLSIRNAITQQVFATAEVTLEVFIF